jgi:PPK2 family polyphosphate:nucleotide phosphotransferase
MSFFTSSSGNDDMHDPLHPVEGKIDLRAIDPGDTGKFNGKKDAEQETQKHLKQLFDLHYMMFAENRRALLVILQGIDASGKDGAVRHLAGGLNPQGMKIYSFNKPSLEELDHDYLWRIHKAAPGRGEVGLFNRSHYEEVTTVKVHPKLLEAEQLPPEVASNGDLFKQRYRQINDFERILAENGTHIVKLLLHISKEKQEERFQKRLHDRRKHWKFSEGDLIERQYWDDYMNAFEEMIEHTGKPHAPWYIIPADRKWYRNYLVGKILVDTLAGLKMEFPGN